MNNSMNIPELETLSYHSSLCKYPDCENKPASAPREGNDKTTPIFEPKTGAENKESVGQPIEQLKDNPGPLEKLIMDRIEHDLENIAANLEMLNPETKEQQRAKCVLTLEIAHITGKGGMFDELKEAFE